MKRSLIGITLAMVVLVTVITGTVRADPLPGEVLKFYQTPLNNGLVLMPPGGTLTPGSVPAPWPGHDEVSTAYLTNGNQYVGQYMADDFCDLRSTPIVHVMWWGSYMSNQVVGGVTMFLIMFETDVSATASNNTLGYSHPGTNIVTQIVTLGALAPGSGTYTETAVPIGAGPPNPDGNLFQYNAELAVPVPEGSNVVEWIKIVALTSNRQIVWGWHNRDYGVMDPLACTPPAVVPGEFNANPPGPPIWHFQDDAVTGPVAIIPGPSGPIAFQSSWVPTSYFPPYDGISFSKDLAFALYTTGNITNNNPTNSIVINECGAGTTNGSPITGVLTVDPGPGGLPHALTYHLPFPGIAGDVIMHEGEATNASDIARFNGNGTVVFYSDVSPGDPPDALADGPMPTSFYAITTNVFEIGPEDGTNGVTYIPTPGKPGYDPSGPVYTFISDVPLTITVDEGGKGMFGCMPFSGTLTNDPGPGGQPQALTYPLPYVGIPGDVFISESPAGGPPSDIIRFNGNSTLVFYSDPFSADTNDCPDSLADGAGPTVLYSTEVFLTETGPEGGTNGATYTPTPGEPGYDPSGPTYIIISDYPPSSPDPFTAWQLKYFGCSICSTAAPGADPDGDGMINTNEFLLGTDPTNSLSYFHITSIARQGSGSNDINITWAARPCKDYIVQVSSGTTNDGSYVTNVVAFADIPGSLTIGGVVGGGFVKGDVITNYVDVGGATNQPTRYYRVRLVP